MCWLRWQTSKPEKHAAGHRQMPVSCCSISSSIWILPESVQVLIHQLQSAQALIFPSAASAAQLPFSVAAPSPAPHARCWSGSPPARTPCRSCWPRQGLKFLHFEKEAAGIYAGFVQRDRHLSRNGRAQFPVQNDIQHVISALYHRADFFILSNQILQIRRLLFIGNGLPQGLIAALSHLTPLDQQAGRRNGKTSLCPTALAGGAQ